MQAAKPDLSLRVLWFGLVPLAAFALILFVVEVVLQDVPPQDRPFLVGALGWLAYFGIYPAAILTLAGLLSWLDRPGPPRDQGR